MPDQNQLTEVAHTWIKANANVLIERFAPSNLMETEQVAVTVFMAGSPGVGKTEVSKRLIERFNKQPVRIDADEIRTMCPGYTGENAHIFQKAANKGVNILYDHALEKGYNIILDGTFAYGMARENVGRSLDKGRNVELLFVHQDPVSAWDFTKKREAVEGRRVTRDVFINAWLQSRENIRNVMSAYGDRVTLSLIIKDIEGQIADFKEGIKDIDVTLGKSYAEGDLEQMIC